MNFISWFKHTNTIKVTKDLALKYKHTYTQNWSLLVFAVLAVVVLSTFAGVAVGGTGFANTGGNVLTGVELTSVYTLSAKVTCRTDRKK